MNITKLNLNMEWIIVIVTLLVICVMSWLLNTKKLKVVDVIVINGKFVPIKVANDSINYTSGQDLIKKWAESIVPSLIVSSLIIDHCTYFRPGSTRANFILMRAEARDNEGNVLPGVVFLRGKCVAILVQYTKNGITYVVTVEQARIATGKYCVEAVAGMLDGTNNPVGTAMNELREETGIVIPDTSVLVHLGKLYTSQGLLDEEIELYMYNIPSDENVSRLHNLVTGNANEGEHIKVKVIKRDDAYKSDDCKLLALLARADNRELQVNNSV